VLSLCPPPTVLADRGYFKGEEILECERSGINALVPKPQTPSPAPDKTYAPLKLEGRPGDSSRNKHAQIRPRRQPPDLSRKSPKVNLRIRRPHSVANLC